ncbi:MAG: hypothetical protein KC587_13640 [Nitrospira sp.]|nr:hypothetical protein [Nitrospira sp.]MCA9457702.1 hypothetical protein [Nitrospira sp.]
MIVSDLVLTYILCGIFSGIAPLQTLAWARLAPYDRVSGHSKPGVVDGNRAQSGAREGPLYQRHTWVHPRYRTRAGGVGSKEAEGIDRARAKWEVTKTEAVIQPTTNRRDV